MTNGGMKATVTSNGPPYTPTSARYGLDHELTGAHAPQPNPNPMPSTDPPPPDPGPPTEPGYNVFHGQPSNPELTDPDLDHQSLSTDSQPVDLQAAIYAAKGKAKESRRISGTARELQPDERSLDPGD
jgi:hypothetical protein